MEFNSSTFILEIINFLVLIWILQLLFYKPILAVIAKRKAIIDQSIIDTQLLQQQAEEQRSLYESRQQLWEQEKQAALSAFHQQIDLERSVQMQQLKADFEAYLDGFSPNVQDILENFEFRNQIPRLSKADALGTLIEKLLAPDINLSPYPVRNGDGTIKHPGLDNHGQGTLGV